jgi:hypothetical protein
MPACCVIETFGISGQVTARDRSLLQKPTPLLTVLCDFVVQAVVEREDFSQIRVQRSLNRFGQ